MTSPTGNKRGFTFVEVMMAAAILSLGIVLIYRSFFASLNYLEHVTYRLHANTLLDNKIAAVQKIYEDTHQPPPAAQSDSTSLTLNHKNIDFRFILKTDQALALENIYEVAASVEWREHGREIHLTREFYLTGY